MLVRLRASGVCHSDWNAVDGTSETVCPAVLGHEGAGVVEEIGAGVTRVAVGDHVALSWTPWCGTCEECARDLPQLCSTVWPAMATGGLMDGTPRLSRDGEPVYHYSFLSTFADACVVPERSCIPIAEDVPFEVAALVGCAVSTGAGAVWRTAGVQAGDRVAVRRVRRRRALGADGGGRRRGGAGRRRRCSAAEARRRALVRRDGRRRVAGKRRRRRPRPCARSPAAASTTRRGDRPAGGDGGGVPLDAHARRGRADRHPARRMRCSRSRRSTIPRMERRVLGSIYGSTKPERDFPRTLDLYRAGPAAARPPRSRTGCRSRRSSAGSSSCTPATRCGWCSSCERPTELDGRIGEGWSGEAPNGSHVNIVLARRGSPTAAAAISHARPPLARPYARPRLRRARPSRSTSRSGRRR